MTTIGSLFSGYGGLDRGVQLALGPMRTAWVSDIEPGPQAILAERLPDAPNLGDITTIDWRDVEPVDILVGGSPCQDLSTAGQRAGMKPGTRSGLWESMTHAIEQLQPRLVVWENVRGALSAEAYSDSNMGFFEGLVDERTPSQRPAKEKDKPLRALGRVLGDLANLGYDAEWTTVRASDVGAPHRRERVFVIACPHDDGLGGLSGRAGGRTQEIAAPISDTPLLPSPCAQQSGNSPELHLSKKPGRERVTDLAIIVENGLLATGGRLLPTPTVGDKGGPEARSGEGFGAPLGEVARLLSTPQARDGKGVPQDGYNLASLPRDVALLRTPCAAEAEGGPLHPEVAKARNQTLRLTGQVLAATGNLADSSGNTDNSWGEYAPAIRRWEHILGREAPAPTTLSAHGKPHLSPAFEEWMMGLPQGWVTDIDISRATQLRALGNGVVPQQGAAAITRLLGRK